MFRQVHVDVASASWKLLSTFRLPALRQAGGQFSAMAKATKTAIAYGVPVLGEI